MSARVVKLTGLKYRDTYFDTLWVILDQHSSPPILPLMYTTQLSRFGVVYDAKELSVETARKRIKSLEPREVSDSTIRAYVYCLAKFFTYLEHCKETHQTPGMHASSSCSEKFVNHYLNHVLAQNLDSSLSLNTHRSALMSYFTWLAFMEIRPSLNLRIYRKTRQAMAEKSIKQNYIQYVSKFWRFALLNACETLAEKLMMRMGYEVGLRTSELRGLRVSGKNNLSKLFTQLSDRDCDHINYFRYWLEGRYTKGSKSRWIYFDRNLLIDMKRYFDTERQWLIDETGRDDNSFFLRTDQRFKGTEIGEEQASRIFRKRAEQAGLNSELSFHDLRHTFATELFQAEIEGPDGRETRSESAALIAVSQRLGHKIGKDGNAPPVTTRYIRMRLQMMELEDAEHG